MRKEFEVHVLNDAGMAKANDIAEAFSELLDKAESIVPAGRDLALVTTKLQEASFFAKRGIASLPEHQQAAAAPATAAATPSTPTPPPAS